MYLVCRTLHFLLLIKTAYFAQVLKKRVPFLMNSIVDFKEHFPHGNNDRPVSETDHHELTSDYSLHLKLRNQDILKYLRARFYWCQRELSQLLC